MKERSDDITANSEETLLIYSLFTSWILPLSNPSFSFVQILLGSLTLGSPKIWTLALVLTNFIQFLSKNFKDSISLKFSIQKASLSDFLSSIRASRTFILVGVSVSKYAVSVPTLKGKRSLSLDIKLAQSKAWNRQRLRSDKDLDQTKTWIRQRLGSDKDLEKTKTWKRQKIGKDKDLDLTKTWIIQRLESEKDLEQTKTRI